MPLIQAQAGQQLVETLETDDGVVLYSATHEVGADNQLRTINEGWAEPALQTLNPPAPQPPPVLRGAETGIAVVRLAWDVIKKGKATAKTHDAMSSVLSQDDRDPLHYEGARQAASGAYTWTVCDSLIKSIKHILSCNVNFPCSASGSANISNVSNVGRGSVDPSVRVHAKLRAGWFAQHMGITVGFSAQGSRGFALIGKEG